MRAVNLFLFLKKKKEEGRKEKKKKVYWPDCTGLVFLRDDCHDKRRKDARRLPCVDRNLVVAVPEHDGRVVRQPADLVAQLCLLRRSCYRAVGTTSSARVLHVVVDEYTVLVARIVECSRVEDASPPNAQGVHSTVSRALDKDSVRLCIQPA